MSEWVRIHPERLPGGSWFESWTPATDPPGHGWLHADPAVVSLLFAMQTRVFRAEEALRAARVEVAAAYHRIDKEMGNTR